MCSCFSGRCDIFDSLVAIHADGDPTKIDFSKIKIYAYGNDLIPLRIDCEKDLVPYYPYLESLMCGGGDGNIVIHLSKESFVDEEESNSLQWRLNELIRYWSKCKRNKKEFYVNEALKHCFFADCNSAYAIELATRVSLYGKKATYEGIHLSLHDHYRDKLYNEMVRVGYTEDEAYRWCYGWDRWLDKKKNK